MISFYVFDTGVHDFNAMAATYGGTYSKSFGLNDAGANLFASEFAKRGVPVLKKRFEEHGMQLLTPIEFLETDAQKAAYVGLELPKSGYQKFAKAIRGWLDKNPSASGAADGFAMIPTHLWLDAGIMGVLEELRMTLGLDGLAVLTNLTTSNPKTVRFAGASLSIFGPNPEPKPEKFAKYWFPGLLYAGGTFGKGFKGLDFAYWAKKSKQTTSVPNPIDGSTTSYSGKAIERAEYDGYDGVIDQLARRTLEELLARYDKGK
ncbi:MAG: hypothetical protein GY716_04310 [bacterium]|nr:hypothetical protein [bacterium]